MNNTKQQERNMPEYIVTVTFDFSAENGPSDQDYEAIGAEWGLDDKLDLNKRILELRDNADVDEVEALLESDPGVICYYTTDR